MALGDTAPATAAGAVIDDFLDALGRGDLAAARGCCTPDVRIWHSFDRIAQDIDEAVRGWEGFVSAFSERAFVDARRAATPNGFVQQHLMVGRPAGGEPRAWPICIVVTIREGRIARFEEYMDRAGSYPVADANQTTPGLPPRDGGKA